MNTQKGMVLGETIAAEYLEAKGYTILGRNFLYRGSELDIVAVDPSDGYYVFVEVKYRSRPGGIRPLDEITPEKIKYVKKGATLFLLERNLYEKVDVRFDAVSVVDDAVEEHIKNAF